MLVGGQGGKNNNRKGAIALSDPDWVDAEPTDKSRTSLDNLVSVHQDSSCFVDMSFLDLEGLSRDEKIKCLKASITSLEEETRKQQEDRKLQQLMNKNEELT